MFKLKLVFRLAVTLSLIISILFSSSCTHHKKHIAKEVHEVVAPPVIEKEYYVPKEVKEEYDIKGFINRSQAKQSKERFELRSMKFTANLFDKLVCMNFMNTLFSKDVKARFTDNYSPKFDPNFIKNLEKKFNYSWSNEFGNLVLKFGDKSQGIYGCGQIILSSSASLNNMTLKSDIEHMIKILNPAANKLVLDMSWKKLSYKDFIKACTIFHENNFSTVALNYQKNIPEFPSISKELAQDYKNTRLQAASYLNNAMFKGCEGQFVPDESSTKSIQSFVENYIYCTECDTKK